MSNIRAAPYTMKDKDDDAAFQALKEDVTQLKLAQTNGGSPGISGEIKLRLVDVCVDGVEMQMWVMGSAPF